MNANERRMEIMRILTARRRETAPRLARELGVCVNTIRNDILVLTADYPLVTAQGNGGCVRVEDWYHPHRNMLSGEQQDVLSNLIERVSASEAKVLREMLLEYGSAKCRQKMKEVEKNAG